MAPLTAAQAWLAHSRGRLLSAIDFCNLIVQRPVIIEIAEGEQTDGEKIQDACDPFAHIHTMNAEEA